MGDQKAVLLREMKRHLRLRNRNYVLKHCHYKFETDWRSDTVLRHPVHTKEGIETMIVTKAAVIVLLEKVEKLKVYRIESSYLFEGSIPLFYKVWQQACSNFYVFEYFVWIY